MRIALSGALIVRLRVSNFAHANTLGHGADVAIHTETWFLIGLSALLIRFHEVAHNSVIPDASCGSNQKFRLNGRR